MTDTAAQIVTLFEEHGISPDALARDFGYEQRAIEMVLIQNSKKFREALKGTADASEAEEEELFNRDDMKQAASYVRTLARDSESDVVRMKASEFIINEGKGRNNIIAAIKNAPAMNILVLNQHFAQARQRIEEMKRVKGIGPVLEQEKQVA